MAYHLVVRQPFDGRSRGEVITDPATVSTILAGEWEGHVIRVTAPATPAPAAAPAVPAQGA